MADERKLIMGIDLGIDEVQCSYYYHGMEEPESALLGYASQNYYIPLTAYKKIGEKKWAFGDTGRRYYEAGEYLKVENILDKVIDGSPVELEKEQYMPQDILEGLFTYMIKEVLRSSESDAVDKISIGTTNFSKRLLDICRTVLLRMGYKKENILFLNHTECFIYYALHGTEDLYKKGVCLYDFHKGRLTYSYMNYAMLQGKTIVMVDTSKAKINSTTPEEVDAEMEKVGLELLNNCAASSVYLTGQGFEEYEHLDRFIQAVCVKKRAFMGSNIYAKGAAIGAFETFYGGNYKNRLLACEDRILSDIDIEIEEREQEKLYRAVRVGTNWYMASKTLRFIVDGADAVKIHIKPIEKKEDQDIEIPLDEFPKRPDRTTKILVELDFNNATGCRVMVKDLGFGEFYKATGKNVFRDIKL